MAPLKQYAVVVVVGFRNQRFNTALPVIARHPKVGDVGTIVEVHESPQLGYEVECVNQQSGETVWLETMFPEELSCNR
jgi:hypothetical protein